MLALNDLILSPPNCQGQRDKKLIGSHSTCPTRASTTFAINSMINADL
jgi:hypothetical protein